MTSWKIIALVSFVAGVGAICGEHYLRQEREPELARLRRENARMRAVLDQRPTPQTRAISPAVQNAADSSMDPPTAVAANASFSNDHPTLSGVQRHWPVRRYFNAGQATPIDALQTMAWACDQGDVETMARLFLIDEAARPKADEIYSALPPQVRANWNSVEAASAAIIVHNGIEQPYPGTQVLALATIEPVAKGRVRLVLPGAIVSGLIFQQTAEGWKYVITEAVVNDFLAQQIPPTSKR